MPTSITTAPSFTKSAADKFSLADCRDQNVCGSRDVREISTARVRNGHGGVTAFSFSHQEEAGAGHPHEHAAPDDHHMRTGCFDAAFQEKALTS